MTRTQRIVIAVSALAIGAIGVATAQYVPEELHRRPASQLVPAVEQRVAPADAGGSAVPAPQSGPRARYKTLLKTIEVAADQAQYGDFCDYGYYAGTSYSGHDDLPPGYWVYLAPNWYIFKDAVDGGVATPQTPRAWGPEQATGAPDTWPNAGDVQTAWASKTPDDQREWLELTYDAPLRPVAVTIYETFNPGAVDRVTGYDANGKEVELWTGTDPTAVGSEKGISVIPLHPGFDLTRICVYLDSPKVAGWNEIDAVGLLDAAGTTHWAVSATASSTYADLTQGVGDLPVEKLGAERPREFK